MSETLNSEQTKQYFCYFAHISNNKLYARTLNLNIVPIKETRMFASYNVVNIMSKTNNIF